MMNRRRRYRDPFLGNLADQDPVVSMDEGSEESVATAQDATIQDGGTMSEEEALLWALLQEEQGAAAAQDTTAQDYSAGGDGVMDEGYVDGESYGGDEGYLDTGSADDPLMYETGEGEGSGDYGYENQYGAGSGAGTEDSPEWYEGGSGYGGGGGGGYGYDDGGYGGGYGYDNGPATTECPAGTTLVDDGYGNVYCAGSGASGGNAAASPCPAGQEAWAVRKEVHCIQANNPSAVYALTAAAAIGGCTAAKGCQPVPFQGCSGYGESLYIFRNPKAANPNAPYVMSCMTEANAQKYVKIGWTLIGRWNPTGAAVPGTTGPSDTSVPTEDEVPDGEDETPGSGDGWQPDSEYGIDDFLNGGGGGGIPGIDYNVQGCPANTSLYRFFNPKTKGEFIVCATAAEAVTAQTAGYTVSKMLSCPNGYEMGKANVLGKNMAGCLKKAPTERAPTKPALLVPLTAPKAAAVKQGTKAEKLRRDFVAASGAPQASRLTAKDAARLKFPLTSASAGVTRAAAMDAARMLVAPATGYAPVLNCPPGYSVVSDEAGQRCVPPPAAMTRPLTGGQAAQASRRVLLRQAAPVRQVQPTRAGLTPPVTSLKRNTASSARR